MSEYSEIPIDYKSQTAEVAAGHTWDGQHDAAVGRIPETSLRCEIYAYHSATGFWLRRAFLVYDTSSIPSDAVITDAKIQAWVGVNNLYSFVRNDFGGSSVALDVIDGALVYPHYPIVFGDYYRQHYSLILGGVSIPVSANEEWIDIPLNSNGIARIQKGTGGKTRFAIMLDWDAENTPPTSDGYYYAKLSYSGYDVEPKLVVTYTSSQTLLVQTNAFTNVTKTSLTMNGEITSGVASKRGFDYGAVSGALTDEWYEEGTFGPGAFTKEITGLTPGQEFCCKAKACE